MRKQINWEEIKKELLAQYSPIESMLKEWGNDAWEWDFWFDDYPPKFYLEFVKVKMSGRCDIGVYDSIRRKEPLTIKRHLTDDDVLELSGIITQIAYTTKFTIYKYVKAGVVRYSMYNIKK